MQKVKLLSVQNEKILSSSHGDVSAFMCAWACECVCQCVLRGGRGLAATLQALAVALLLVRRVAQKQGLWSSRRATFHPVVFAPR